MSSGTSSGNSGATAQVSEDTRRRGGGSTANSALVSPAFHLNDDTTSKPWTHTGIFAVVEAAVNNDPTFRKTAR